jgi:hypothetical protein
MHVERLRLLMDDSSRHHASAVAEPALAAATTVQESTGKHRALPFLK